MKDSFQRKIDYLRISVTDRCNLRCVYCMPAEGIKCVQHSDILRYEEIFRLIKAFTGLGINKIRITGGEPLVRKGILDFMKKIRTEMPEIKLCLTTNLHCKPEFINLINELKLHSINVSIDSLKPEIYKKITRYGDLNLVLNNLHKLKNSRIKINAVVLNGINETEIFDFSEWADKNNYELRFIEKMSSFYKEHCALDNSEILKRLSDKNILKPEIFCKSSTAVYYKYTDSDNVIGFINPVSEPFCSRCNRIRLTSNGKLKLCLFQKQFFDIKSLLGLNDLELSEQLKKIVYEKPECGAIQGTTVSMNYYGG